MTDEAEEELALDGDRVVLGDRLRVGWLNVRGVPREQKMLKGYLPNVIYHQVY